MLGRAESETKPGLSLNQNRIDSGSAHGCSCNEGGHKCISLALVGCLVTLPPSIGNKCPYLFKVALVKVILFIVVSTPYLVRYLSESLGG
jgi:hypothetical protein